MEIWLTRPGIVMLAEPVGLDELLGRWTDGYLAAFAMAGGCRLVALDGDFRRYGGVDFLHLVP